VSVGPHVTFSLHVGGVLANWDSSHCVGSSEMPKSTAFPTLIWEA
jgi:hypothetical protein